MEEKAELLVELHGVIKAIDTQIDFVMAEASRQGKHPLELRLPDGSWPMAPLLVAKAQALAAIVDLVRIRG